MPIDVDVPDSPGWWMQKCAAKLESRLKRLHELNERLEGRGPLPHGAEGLAPAYREFQKKARTNWPGKIVRSRTERMRITGFRTAGDDDENGDTIALDMWNASGMGVEFADIKRQMLGLGDAYAIVSKVGGQVVATGEDPRQVVTIHDPAVQRIIRAALKVYHDDDEGMDYAYLYRPGRVYVAKRERKLARGGRIRFAPGSWDWDEDRGGEAGKSIPGKVLPVVRFRNELGVSEFEEHVDLLDRITHQVLQRLVIIAMQAYRQRAVVGAPDEDEDTGEQIDYDSLLQVGPGAVWRLPEGVTIEDLAQAEITGVLSAVKDDVRELSAVSNCPMPSMMPDNANQTAEGASATKEGLIFTVADRIDRAGEAAKDLLAIMFALAGDPVRADRAQITPLWAPPEHRSLAEKGDVSSKAGADLPLEERLVAIWGYTPKRAAELAALKESEKMLEAALAAQPLTVPNAG